MYSEYFNESKMSLAWGAGIAFNPTSYLSVNIGYEGTRAKYNKYVTFDGFNMSIGYRF